MFDYNLKKFDKKFINKHHKMLNGLSIVEPIYKSDIKSFIQSDRIKLLEEVAIGISCLDSEYQGEPYRKGFNETKHNAIEYIKSLISKIKEAN